MHRSQQFPQVFRSARRVFQTAITLGVAAGMTACSVGTPRLQTADQPLPAPGRGPLKAHLQSGELVVFETWREEVAARELVGTGSRYDRDRELVSIDGDLRLSVDSIALLELIQRETDLGHGAGITLLAYYTISAGLVTAVCVADPKSCFGSCPTFYLDDEAGGERLMAEGFSASVARVLEATDLDDLRWRAGEGPLSFRMRNEALETHAVRSLRLHAVPEPEGSRAFATADGRFRLATRVLEPSRCAATEGDCLDLLRAPDGRERRSWTDSTDLAARETIELEFPAPGARAGLVVAARHSFVSTFLFYQTLAYLGSEAGAFLASMERGDGTTAERVREVQGMLGRIEVRVHGPDGAWHPVGVIDEAGPLATDIHLLELPESAGRAPVRVRLELTRGFWRIEHVALAELGGAVEATVLSPVAAERLAGPGPWQVEGGAAVAAPDALEALLDPNRYLVTEPGDHFRFTFELPGHGATEAAAGGTYRLFLESTGYYYEWMRPEWLQEESAVHAAMMLFDPQTMFVRLAPAFKRIEPVMEEAFWNSRFRR
jgi:hypothetical protein